ncbi:MAG TPA: hypothetical protein VE954_34000 [Oligoflexus sp.]|uniref:hypothetical protein n=1 Tax=Oligoflexus sp. TaxID=1971216 RepID=UPI002D7371D2|nr:hypothetical protein [Oligoflexus sp.]HYX38141.1 hypothetical protein [Oligoflexus sp.]
MSMSRLCMIVLGLASITSACGGSSSKSGGPDGELRPGYEGPSLQAPILDPPRLEFNFADARLKQEITVGPASMLGKFLFEKGVYSHRIGFKVTNLLETTRCFMRLDLRADGYQSPGLMGMTFVRGRLMKVGPGSTNTCLEPGGTGFVVDDVESRLPEPRTLTLHGIDDNGHGAEAEPLNEVSVLSQTLTSDGFKVVLRNDALPDGLDTLGFTKWVITSGDAILEWGFLDISSSRDKTVVPLNETVEITVSAFLKGSLPQNARLHIIMDSMEDWNS